MSTPIWESGNMTCALCGAPLKADWTPMRADSGSNRTGCRGMSSHSLAPENARSSPLYSPILLLIHEHLAVSPGTAARFAVQNGFRCGPFKCRNVST